MHHGTGFLAEEVDFTAKNPQESTANKKFLTVVRPNLVTRNL